ncbi:MAG: murein L,D-transpeptidase, partial [Verrucomicrobiaceae bacterium]|nr:murein L,D-transpeptidase [Verrucomicrobiaceae bacterium]
MKTPFLRPLLSVTVLLGLTHCATTNAPRVLPAKAAQSETLDSTVQLQIFLDAQHFGPGVVDGRTGEFTTKALDLYRKAKGLSSDASPDVSGISPYTTYTIRADDLSVLGTMGESPAEIAKQARQPYTSLKELLAERFHTTQAFMAQLNPGVALDSLTSGAVITVPNVKQPFRADAFPSAYPKRSVVAGVTRHIEVSLQARMLQVLDGGQL